MNTTDHRFMRLAEAAAVVERMTGRRPAVQTLHRWVKRGLANVRLSVTYIGGHRYVNEKMLLQFFEEVTRVKSGLDATPTSLLDARSTRRAAEVSLANEELERDGI